MEFGLDKYAVYKYLGVLEGAKIKNREMKERLRKNT